MFYAAVLIDVVVHHLLLLDGCKAGLALGYEDLNDHDELRSDLALQTVVGTEPSNSGLSLGA